MKTPLIALALTVALAATAAATATATGAADQLAPTATPTSPAPAATPHDIHRSNHDPLHAHRERVKADKTRLKLARAAHDDNAVREAQATLQTDMDAWHADRERIKH